MTMRFTVFDLRPEAMEHEQRFEFSQRLDGQGMQEMLDAVLDHGAADGDVHLLVELDGMPRVTATALRAKSGRFKELLRLRGRYAIVTDAAWMQRLAPVANALSPLEVMAFPADHLKEAKNWATAA